MANRLTIYFTSDTHGYLYPSHFCDQQPRPMGLLSMRFPKDGNTLIIDGGDTIQGSPLTYYCYGHHLPLQEGFSTASEEARDLGFGAGMGLPNMKRNADSFEITSRLGEGTTIHMGFRIA